LQTNDDGMSVSKLGFNLINVFWVDHIRMHALALNPMVEGNYPQNTAPREAKRRPVRASLAHRIFWTRSRIDRARKFS
jgi:hypothetical protein